MKLTSLLCLVLASCSPAALPAAPEETVVSSAPIPNPVARPAAKDATVEQRLDEIEAALRRLDDALRAKQ